MQGFDKYFLMKEEDAGRYVQAKLNYFTPDAQLESKEIGDGNLNYVFRVWEPSTGKSIIVKQAGEELRISKEMKISTDRNRIESEILKIQDQFAPGLVPEIYQYDTIMCACMMEDLSDYQLMRTALMQHKTFPRFADDIAFYMVNTLLKSTDVVMEHKAKKDLVKNFINPELCEITEDLVFTEPYTNCAGRNLVFPLNAGFVQTQLYGDESLHLEVAKLKFEFMTNAQALIHGDLHTGSIFVKPEGTKVFDPEFAFYGPMGYDIGNVIANLLFAWGNGFAHNKTEFCAWILTTIQQVIDLFSQKFLDCFATSATEPMAKVKGFEQYYLNSILADTAAYAGTELIRRTVGMAQVKDITSIEDPTTRALVERINILCGKDYILHRAQFLTGSNFVDAFGKARQKTK